MITREDCIGFCGLSEREVLALAEHEHIPEIAAAALGQHLLHQEDGCRRIAAMIADDVNWAAASGDQRHAEELRATLGEFVGANPKGLASVRAQACLGGRRRSAA